MFCLFCDSQKDVQSSALPQLSLQSQPSHLVKCELPFLFVQKMNCILHFVYL